MKIGVFDSGIGGLSILKELYSLRPDVDYYYFSDSRFAPYGNKSQELIFERCQFITERFIEMGISQVLVACNTATAWCIDRLRLKYQDIEFYGVEPFFNIINKDASYKDKHGLCLVTELTNNSKRFQKLKQRIDKLDKIKILPLKNLAKDIEVNYFLNSNFQEIVSKNLSPYKEIIVNNDFLILGCTHYPIVKKDIESLFQRQCISPCQSVAHYIVESLEKDLSQSVEKSKEINFFNSLTDNDWNVMSFKQLIRF